MLTLQMKQVQLLKKAVLDNDDASLGHSKPSPLAHSSGNHQIDDDAYKYASRQQNSLDPSSMGFDDYLVHTYDDGPQLTSSQDTAKVAPSHRTMVTTNNKAGGEAMNCSGQSHKITLENQHNDTYETNLLDETSKFEKNLNSATSWCEITQNVANTVETMPAMNCDSDAKMNNNISTNGYNHKIRSRQSQESQLVQLLHQQSQNPMVFSQVGQASFGGDVTANVNNSNMHELSTNDASQAYGGQASSNAYRQSVLKNASQIGKGASLQTSSALYTRNIVDQQAPGVQQHKGQQDFITFKPMHAAVMNGDENNQCSRNPFPQKFKQQGQESPERVSTTMTKSLMKFEDLSFQDNIRKESECYVNKLSSTGPPGAMTSPQVISQHSRISSSNLNNTGNMQQCFSDDAESTVGAQLTLSQLCAAGAAFENQQQTMNMTANGLILGKQHMRLPSNSAERSTDSQQQLSQSNMSSSDAAKEATASLQMQSAAAAGFQQRVTLTPLICYPSQLVELPSRIQEESQEFSYSYTNPAPVPSHPNNEMNLMKECQTLQQSSEERNGVVTLGSPSASIVNTQDSKLQSPSTIQQSQGAGATGPSKNQQQPKQTSHIKVDEDGLADSSVASAQSQHQRTNSYRQLQANFVQAQAAAEAVDAKQYISDGLNYRDNYDQEALQNENRDILSETHNHLDQVLSYAHCNSRDRLEQISVNGQQQSLDAYSLPYSNLLDLARKPDHQYKESGDQQMLELAQVLLHQLSSQHDHFSQRDLALMTSISSQQTHKEQDGDEISRIEGEDDGSNYMLNLHTEQNGQMPLFTKEDEEELINNSQHQYQIASERKIDIKPDESQRESKCSQASGAKELYENRMRDMKKKRAGANFNKPANKSKTAVRPTSSIQLNRQTLRGPQQIAVNQTSGAPVASGAPVEGADSFYHRNVQWKNRINDINMCKRQIQDHQNIIKEVEECTFRPNLNLNKQQSANIVQKDAPLSQVAVNSNIQVEDRCLQWASHNKKKKEQTEKRLREQTECTFNPTLVSKQFKNRLCPSYDYKHSRDKQIAKDIEQEYDYFTLRRYLNMNDESKSDLEKLCQFYSTEGHSKTESGKDNTADGKNPEKMTDRDKMLLIASFIERSEQWKLALDKKKEKAAQEMQQERCKENTFHPRINTVSELMHLRKIELLEQVNKAAAAVNEQNKNKAQAIPDILEKETKENLFEYYLPKRKLMGQPAQSDKQMDLPMQPKIILNTDIDQLSGEVRPLQSDSEVRTKSQEKNENKHPKGEQVQPQIDINNEQRRFNKLIELLSQKLSEKSEEKKIVADFMPMQILLDNKREAKGDKQENNGMKQAEIIASPPQQQIVVSPPQQEIIVSPPQQQLLAFNNTHEVSFQQQSQSLEKETELIHSMQQILKLSSDELQKTSTASKQLLMNTFSLSQRSEETSRFQPTAFEKSIPCATQQVKPLDLAQLTIKEQTANEQNNNSHRENHEKTLSLTRPLNFHPDQQPEQSFSSLNIDTLSMLNNAENKSAEAILINATTQSLIDTQSFSQQNLHGVNSQEQMMYVAQNDSNDAISVTQTSSSMQKHLEYIYKRNLRTSRREETTNQAFTIETDKKQASNINESSSLVYDLTNQEENVIRTLAHEQQTLDESKAAQSSSRQTTLFHGRQRSTECLQQFDEANTLSVRNNQPSYVSSSQITTITPTIVTSLDANNHQIENEKAYSQLNDHCEQSSIILVDDGQTTDRRSRRSDSGSNTKHLFKKRDKSQTSDLDDGQTTDRRSRRSCSGSNTKHLFKKRDKSQTSDGNSSSTIPVTSRTELPRSDFPLMTNEDVILHEHLFAAASPVTTVVETPTLSLRVNLEDTISTSRSVKQDSQIFKLSEKLKKLKIKEDRLQSTASFKED